MLIKGGQLVTDKMVKTLDIRIKGEKIVEIGSELKPYPTEEIIAARDKLILPGLIDSHTHFALHSRGTVTADDFYQGGISAVYGGVTTIIDYADQADDSLIKGIEHRQEIASKSLVDYSLHLVLNNAFDPEQHGDELYKLRDSGISSLKIFTTYRDLYLLPEKKLESLFSAARETQLLITAHAEDDGIIKRKEEEYRKKGKLTLAYHPQIRPGIAEAAAIHNLLLLAKKNDCPIYIVHLSSKEGYAEVIQAKEKGARVIVETAPHYLFLTEELLRGDKSQLFLMTPPLRRREDKQALWQGICQGIITVIASDHCAFNLKQKEEGKDSLDTLPGIPGVETMLPLLYTYGVRKGIITLNKLVELLSYNPAKIFGLYPEKGSLEEGSDADLLLYDPGFEGILDAARLHSAAGYTPFQGMKIRGKVVMTMLRGQVIIDGERLGGKSGYGKFIKAQVSSVYKG